MMNVIDYVNLILKKKKMTRTEFCRRINEVESKLGDKRTYIENITNWLNNKTTRRAVTLLKWEKALGLMEGTLVHLTKMPQSKEAKEEFKKMQKKIREVYK